MSGSVAIRITRGRVPTNCRTCQPLLAEPDDPRWVSGRDIEEHGFRLMLDSVPATREQPRLVSDRNTHVLSSAVQFNRLGFPDQPVRRRHPFRVAAPAPGCQPSGTPSAAMQQFSPRRALSTQGFLRYRRNDRRPSGPSLVTRTRSPNVPNSRRWGRVLASSFPEVRSAASKTSGNVRIATNVPVRDSPSLGPRIHSGYSRRRIA